MIRACFFAVMFWAPIWSYSARAQAPVPSALVAQGEATVLTVHAEGAQIYECKAESSGGSTWLFREPVATLRLNGKTIGQVPKALPVTQQAVVATVSVGSSNHVSNSRADCARSNQESVASARSFSSACPKALALKSQTSRLPSALSRV